MRATILRVATLANLTSACPARRARAAMIARRLAVLL